MPRIRQIPTALVATLTLIVSAQAQADPVVGGYTGGSNFPNYYGPSSSDVVGFRFDADMTGYITDLGILLDPVDGVLNSGHQVGLWDTATQALLGSVTVDGTGTNIGGFLYEPLAAPIPILAGTNYTLGALYTLSDNDSYVSSPSSIDLNFASNPVGVFPAATGLGFVFPTEDSANLARLGPNALFQPIPEPSTLAMSLVGAGLAIGALRRRPRRPTAA